MQTESAEQTKIRAGFGRSRLWVNEAFAPDVLLPVQYDDAIRRPRVLDGEVRLMFAVLEDAVHCYLKNMQARTPVERQEFREVRAWVEALNNGRDLFAFENLCEALGIEPTRLRDRLTSIRLRNSAAGHFRRSHYALGGPARPATKLSATRDRRPHN